MCNKKRGNVFEEIDSICRGKLTTEGKKGITGMLDKACPEELFKLADEFLENPFLFKYPLGEILRKLFDNNDEFATLLNDFFERTSSDLACGRLYEPLRNIMAKKQDQLFLIIKRMMNLGTRSGVSSGIALSWIAKELPEANKFMLDGLRSKDLALERCSLVALFGLLWEDDFLNKKDCLRRLKEIAPHVDDENTDILIRCLHRASEDSNGDFVDIIKMEMKRRGAKAAGSYLHCIRYRQGTPISLLKQAVTMLETERPDSKDIDIGLAEIYEKDQKFVVERLRKRLYDRERSPIVDGLLLHKIKKAEISPVLEMFESEIDKGNPTLRIVGDSILKDFFPTLDEWVSWCEKWKDDLQKEQIVIDSLRRILTKLINYEPREARDRAVKLAKEIAERKGIDYDSETRSINLGKDSHKGSENKENAVKSLHILNIIKHPNVTVDIKTLLNNLKKFPFVCKAIGSDWLILNARSNNPHILAYIFHNRLPEEKELDALQEEIEKERDVNKRNALKWRIGKLLRPLRLPLYWEDIFQTLDENKIKIKQTKLRDVNNADNILAEAEVLARLAPYFTIQIEPEIDELKPNKLEAMIEYQGEKALVEVATVHQRREVLLASGFIGIPGGKVKNVLLSKFKGQLKEGKANPGMPIILILCLADFMNSYEVENAIYGQLHFSYKIRTDTHEVVEEGGGRAENAFYDEKNTDIVSMVGAYKRNLNRRDPLEGRWYHPPIAPRNGISLEFYVRLRKALFGDSDISPWKSLMKVSGIDEKMAKMLYSKGIDEIGVLAGMEEDVEIEKVSKKQLLELITEARRVIQVISFGSIRFLKGINQKTFDILSSKGIYLAKTLLKIEKKPEDIPDSIWDEIIGDAKRIFNNG